MRKFLSLALKFGSPLIVMLLVYLILDPFKIVQQHDSFYEPYGSAEVGVNKDYMSTSNFDRNYEKYSYDSFIFGNSRSIFYDAAEWAKYLPASSSPYHFDASGETLYGIYKKIQYIDGKGLELNNVLLVLDHTTLMQDKARTEHLFAISPQLENYSNFLEFHTAGFRAFYSKNFLRAYIEYNITGEVKPYMTEGALLMNSPMKYDSKTNEVRFLNEEEIDGGSYYTPEQMAVFYERNKVEETSPATIGKTQKEMLEEIAAIFKKHNTNCKVIINPLYDQKRFSPEDLNYLKRKFGKDQVFDFSGKNDITEDYRNYYEESHYRPKVGRLLLSRIYGKSASTTK